MAVLNSLRDTGVAPPLALEWSTASVVPADGFAYWREEVMRRNVPVPANGRGSSFDARLRVITSGSVHLLEHASSAIGGERSAARCAADGVDDIVLDLMVSAREGRLEVGRRRLQHLAGDFYVLDQAQPSSLLRSRHRALGLILGRPMVAEALGRDPAYLAGRRLPTAGLGALLRSHMIATMNHHKAMDAQQQTLALKAAADMALALLQAEVAGGAAPEQFATGFYAAARGLIERECGDASLTPTAVALGVGCSRASLYRLFAEHGETVGAVIWNGRLDSARQMLAAPVSAALSVAEIGYRCGFLDPPTFNRMFKRRFGMTPREARHQPAHQLP